MSKKVGGSDAPAADDGDDDDGRRGPVAARAGRALEALAAKLDREGVFAASSDGAKGLLRLLGGGRPSSEDSDDDENDADDRSGANAPRVAEAAARRRRRRRPLERPRARATPRPSAAAAGRGGARGAARAPPAVPAVLPPAPPPPVAAPPPPPEPKGFTDGEVAALRAAKKGDATYGKYVRLLEMKMPEAMLALKMKAEGLDPATWWASAVFDDARRAVEAHLASLEAAFAASSSRVAIKEPNSKRAADELSALDGKRHQSVAIGLRKLRERKLESGAAVAAALDAETLTEEDVALADAGAGALREGDAWVLDARTACPRLRPRLAVAAAKLSAPLRLLAAAEQTDRRAFAVEAVQHSEPLKDVLKIALLAGNACNHDAKARLAAGVGVAAGLSKLALVKGGKPYKSLVHFVVQCLADDDPRYGGHVAALETLAAVLADVDRDDAATLDELYGDLDGDASTARSEADAADDAALRSWAAWLGDQLADLRAARSAADGAAAALMRSFGDGGAFGEGDAPAQWFKVLRTCLQALLAARDDLLEERAREARREEREVKEAARRRARHRRDEAFDVDDLFPPKRPTPAERLREPAGVGPPGGARGSARAGIGSATPRAGDAADLAADFRRPDGAGEGRRRRGCDR
ncbi:7S RNA binding protein [Aureococcus anophagefferens]|nr:7S RNA binding protein [Aureococcus anophagefferens]